MTPGLESVSEPPRLADPDEGISVDELQMALRNHGLPLEALRMDVTPPGLHYVQTHYDIPFIDASDFELEVTGAVASPVTLDLHTIQNRPRTSTVVTLECAGNGRARMHPRPLSQPWLVEAVGTAEWSGTPLAPLLRDAGISNDAVEVVFTGADHGVERGVEQDYQRSLSVDQACSADVLLAYEMNGVPLPPQHGYPLRLIVPGWYGMAHVKWLQRIDVVRQAFDGFQMQTYRTRQERDDPGVPLTRMEPRALVVPPGFPDFMSRKRILRPGHVTIEGRAWSGWAPVSAVEVSIDGGGTWDSARLDQTSDRWEWVRWSAPWEATAGSHVLTARAHDSSGRVQPVGQVWNRGGFANNAAQQVPVRVLG
jgi:sulfane dehydrogenase subunit SoxC